MAIAGSATAPTPTFGDSTTKVATTAFVQAALAAVYPVGSIYINATSSTNPATLLGFGTWVAFGAGRVPVGLDASNAAFDTAEETGGSADAIVVSHTHTATVNEPNSGQGHRHSIYARPLGSGATTPNYLMGDLNPSGSGSTLSNFATTGITVSNSTEGSSGTNANLQPYIVVRMWKRTV